MWKMNAKRSLQALLWAASATTTVALAGCSRTEEEVKPDPSVTPDATDPKTHDSAALPTEWTCPQGVSGAKMVLIPWPDGSAYCIDEREAVYAEYKQFLDAKGEDFSGQPPECAWNESFVPGWDDAAHEIPQCSSWYFDTEPDRAANCMDFCDAWAYCAWAGKRLCGVRGADPGALSLFADGQEGQIAPTLESEWFNVCSQGGTTKYPYGDAYERGRCIDQAKIDAEGEDSALAVADAVDSGCRGTNTPYDAVYNMSGSVEQWLNICYTGRCVLQGGRWHNEALSCEHNFGVASINSATMVKGVRCCADAFPKSDSNP
jgi:formylglycine-generating enzyme required for sulfatase activity